MISKRLVPITIGLILLAGLLIITSCNNRPEYYNTFHQTGEIKWEDESSGGYSDDATCHGFYKGHEIVRIGYGTRQTIMHDPECKKCDSLKNK